jgi:hypothetical protein
VDLKGDKGDKGDTGNTGKGLEFNWNGTQLGVRVEGDATYQYVNLKGDKGDKGNDGYTPVKGVDYFDGKDGKDGIDGTNGYTPIRGTDYWTEADQAAIVADVLAALPNGDGVSY